jgi:glycosyltransferase involved in cell wall biosynthesis
VICISEWIRGQLGDTKGTPLEQAHVEVIADAVDWPAAEGEGGVKPQAADRGADLVLGFSGQLIESKGLDLVIEAMGKVPASKRPRLLVAGQDTQTRGAYKATLKALAERVGVAGRVEWLGFLDDVTTLHRRVHAMVCPSREEPLGLVPLEAARFDVPTVANRVGGLAETILDGQTGYLVEPTADAWADALARLAGAGPDTLARLGHGAHERTRTLYSPMAYQERLMAVYGRVKGR